MRPAAIVTVGSELTAGLRLDTNTAEVARALAPRGYEVIEALSVADDIEVLSTAIARLCATCELVVTTGGLGPTHDDVTREAVARASGRELVLDERLVERLKPVQARHTDPRAAEQVLVQAQVFQDARIIAATTGTAPGLVMTVDAATLVLLPGPPAEMRPMLQSFIESLPRQSADPHELGVAGMSESDVQVIAQEALAGFERVGFTVLARPGDVRVLLLDRGCGASLLGQAAAAVGDALGDTVYSRVGETHSQAVVAAAVARSLSLAVAESCTGGMVAASLTDVPGASLVVRGGVVAYDNAAKVGLLGVDASLLARYGAVSEHCALAMAEGARVRLAADIAVSVTGVAGPSGGTPDKPVGLVWFGVADRQGARAVARSFPPTSREAIRARATSVALELFRRAVLDG